MALTTYVSGEVLTAASLNDNLTYAVTVPAAVPGGLVPVTAETAITAQTTVNINSVFTSAYSNYRIMFLFQGSAGDDVFARLRVAGVDASGANYNSQEIQGVSTTVNGARNSNMSSWMLAQNSNGTRSNTICDLFSPALAVPTTMQQTETNTLGNYTSSIRLKPQALDHTVSTAYDGITIYSSSAFTGTYTIYGYGKSL